MPFKAVELKNHKMISLDWIKKEDLPEIVETLNSVIREGKYLFLNEEITDMKGETEWFEHAMKDGMSYLVARADGRIVAGASIHPQTDKHSHLASYGIFVHRDHRDAGLGTILTKELVDTARKRGLEILQLSVYASNDRAKYVYEKCGFKECGKLTRGIKFLDGTYTDEILMELMLE